MTSLRTGAVSSDVVGTPLVNSASTVVPSTLKLHESEERPRKVTSQEVISAELSCAPVKLITVVDYSDTAETVICSVDWSNV